jgi:tRNA pseudouridine38-40 synthase
MARYFIELAYKGTRFSGFQIQDNALTIQSEVERALKIYYKESFNLTGSSRTDTGVHALQNFFHVDTEIILQQEQLYHINAILPEDIVLKKFYLVKADAHSRFDAISREYQYFIYQEKNPFLIDSAWFYPYPVNIDLLNEAAQVLKEYNDFTSFAKKNSQVKTFNCTIEKSIWRKENGQLIYHVEANRFLRGMVKGLVATMLKAGREQISIKSFEEIIQAKDCTKADFTAPSQGLFLVRVNFPEQIFIQ